MTAFRRKSLDQDARLRIQRLYYTGLSLRILAERFSVPVDSIRKALKTMGVPLDSSNRRRESI